MADSILGKMMDRGVRPNVVTYNVLLNGVCRKVSLHPEQRFERTIRNAENMFLEMRRRGIEPDVTSFSMGLHEYSLAHMGWWSLEKLNLMKEKGIYPTVATYISVIKCLCSCGELEDAEYSFYEMLRNGLVLLQQLIIVSLRNRGRKDEDSALKLYRKMKEDGWCVPSTDTYNILTRLFTTLSRDMVKETWNNMKGIGVGPDLDSCTMLINGLCEKQKWKEACQFSVEIIEKGLLLQKATFETLYKGLIQSDMLRTWRRLKKRLDEELNNFWFGLPKLSLKAI